HGYQLLKELDPVAANRIHPNNHRKINQYLSLYAARGVLPSKLYQGKAAEGRTGDASMPLVLITPGADYTRGLRQSIGVREFEDFLRIYLSARNSSANGSALWVEESKHDKVMKENLRKVLDFSKDDDLRIMLEEAIDRVKLNTRRLLRRQKRRVSRLEMVFGWNIHHMDATEFLLSKSEESWDAQVVKPASEILR
ncbi:hypothetical protein AALP_AA6G232500, partial [Arabis alpina]